MRFTAWNKLPNRLLKNQYAYLRYYVNDTNEKQYYILISTEYEDATVDKVFKVPKYLAEIFDELYGEGRNSIINSFKELFEVKK